MNHKSSSWILGTVLLGLGLCAVAAGADSIPTRKTIELPVSNRVFPGESAGAKAAKKTRKIDENGSASFFMALILSRWEAALRSQTF